MEVTNISVSGTKDHFIQSLNERPIYMRLEHSVIKIPYNDT